MSKEENIKKYYQQKYINLKLKNKCIELRKNKNIDIIDKIIDNLRRRAFPYKNKLNITNIELLGCSKEELKIYLENKFKFNMTFENYGDWELDHIKPITKFNLNDENEIKKCFNFLNLQPLWKAENRKKKDFYCERSELST